MSGRTVARAEHTCAHTHRRRSQTDRRLIVGAHPHGEFCDPVVLGQLRQQGKMQSRRLFHGRDTHQSLEFEAKLFARFTEKGGKLLRQQPGLLRLGTGIDLDIETRPAPLRLHLPGQEPGQFHPVNGLDDIEQGHRIGRLVGLQRSDQPQLKITMVSAALHPMGLGFLDPVFTEHALPRRERGIDAGGRLSFRHGDELYRIRAAARCLCCLADPVQDRAEISGNVRMFAHAFAVSRPLRFDKPA